MLEELRDEESPYELRVTLIDSEEKNAFALPGGRVLVLTGLLSMCETPDALAGVLAHEIAHVEQRHGIKALTRSLGLVYFAGALVGGGLEELEAAETIAELASGLMILRYSRDAEREADAIAVEKLHGNRRTAAGMVQFFRALREQHESDAASALRWLSTHPLSSERVASLAAAQADASFTPEPWLDAAEWERLTATHRR